MANGIFVSAFNARSKLSLDNCVKLLFSFFSFGFVPSVRSQSPLVFSTIIFHNLVDRLVVRSMSSTLCALTLPEMINDEDDPWMSLNSSLVLFSVWMERGIETIVHVFYILLSIQRYNDNNCNYCNCLEWWLIVFVIPLQTLLKITALGRFDSCERAIVYGVHVLYN